MADVRFLSRPRALRALAMAGLLLLGLAGGGCELAKQIALQTAPRSERVPAEYSNLPGQRVLVFVWVPPEVRWEYPYLRLDLAAHLGAYLTANVQKVTVVDARHVESYLDGNTQLETNPVEVGRHFRADRIVHLSLHHFSVRDPGMAHYYRGRASGSVEVHEMTAGEGSPKRYPLRSIEAVYPEKGPVSFNNVRPEQIRKATYEVFTVEAGKKFHEYERPLD